MAPFTHPGSLRVLGGGFVQQSRSTREWWGFERFPLKEEAMQSRSFYRWREAGGFFLLQQLFVKVWIARFPEESVFVTEAPKHVINICCLLQCLKCVNAFGISKFIKQAQVLDWT